ncbi:MAG TPA: TonB-dependent receptor [Povalibacter sp.]|uniref:TonB-dependent receptor n=1 Tax=Povalibacter sp. TaxID=1962978 RepID=UPI002B675134|nr:TonB-dependent receptor [Povalibacter sp.]HMN45959.1 TonB-dependent receptor [Povalibacter sp.]
MSEASVTLRRAIGVALAAAVTATSLPVSAEETGSGEGRSIETIIVTAQKREQNLQDVPIVVTAVSGQLLQDSGVKDIKDLTIVAPGLTVTSTSSEASTTARIRGIGTVGDNPGLESSVGVVIDGIYRPRNGVAFGDLGELERIEVLKGPQGTLFGKNTSAGVINVVTRKPSFDFGSDVELTGGNYGIMEGAASITGGFNEVLAGRLFVASRQRDGYLDVVRGAGPRTEDEDYDRDMKTARGQLLFKPSEDLEVRFTGDYTQREENCCAGVPTFNGATVAAVNALGGGAGTQNPPDPFNRTAFMNRNTHQDTKDVGASMEINWDTGALGGATLSSVTGWRDWDFVNGQDVDYTAVDIWYRESDGNHAAEFKQLSQEFRLAGETDRINWMVGAFYADEQLDSKQQLQFGSMYRNYQIALTTSPTTGTSPLSGLLPANGYPLGLGQRDVHEQDSTSWALFTNNNIRFTDALELTLGLRYTNESKDLDTQYRNTHAGTGCATVRAGLPTLNAQLIGAGVPADTINAINRVAVGIGCAAVADPIYNNLDNSQSIDESEWSGTAKLSYRFTDEAMAYASFARGYKAGGFNLDRVRTGDAALPPTAAGGVGASLDTSFDKELVDSYEVGLKTQWLNNTLLLNATVFYQDYTDFQLNTFDGVQFLVTSLDTVTSEGVDLDVVWYTPLEQLSFQGGVTYAKTEIDDPAALANPGLFSQARENDRLSFAPEWSASLSATFDQPIGSAFVWRTNIGAKYMSEYNTGSNLAPQKMQDGYTVVNARTGFGAEDERWMIEAWAQNLTDEEYYQVVFDAPLQTGSYDAFLGAPRTYGLTARFKF